VGSGERVLVEDASACRRAAVEPGTVVERRSVVAVASRFVLERAVDHLAVDGWRRLDAKDIEHGRCHVDVVDVAQATAPPCSRPSR
jgi:hypothetical protein